MSMSDPPRPRPQDRDHSGHDLDVVAAFAGDPFDVDHEIAAALIASCAECRNEFDLHRQITIWLAAAPAVSLADDERAQLHDAVGRVTGKPTVVSMAERRRQRQPGHQRQPGQLLFRIGAAAAALAVVAGLGGVFRNLGGDPAIQAFDTVTSDLAIEAESSAAESSAGAAPTTAATNEILTATEDAARLDGGDSDAVQKEVDELVDEAAQRIAVAPGEEGSAAIAAAVPCQDQVAEREILVSAESTLDGEPIVVYVVAGDDGIDALVFLSGDCSPVDLG
jgi:hypothetical protein